MNVTSVASALSSVIGSASKDAPAASGTFGDFAELLSGLGKDAVKTLQTAETSSLAALSGQESTREVVDAVMSAERTLQIAVGVRDKIVSAYLDLNRMSI